MNGDDEYSKFTSSLSKFIGRQWAKVRHSTGSIKSTQNIDQLLEEEYETLLKEVDYLTSEKSCFLSFKNDHFPNDKSSEDLTNILKNHSDEVLKSYIAKHDKETAKADALNNRRDLINYVTEIIVSRPKCNNKLCTCKPVKTSKEVLTDSTPLKENGKGTQTISHSSNKSTENSTTTKQSDNTGKNAKTQVRNVTTAVQTDYWDHDPNCTCGCCPKTGSQITTKSVLTERKEVQNASTSDRKVTNSKYVHANCTGDTIETQTSTAKLCVPTNFEQLLQDNETITEFSACVGKKDCSCDAYDAKEAIKRGLILPSSDICIQNKKVSIKEEKKAKKKYDKQDSASSDSNANSSSTLSSDDSKKNSKAKKKEKEKDKKKKDKEDKNKSDSSEQSESTNSTPRGKPKKEKEGSTGCFGKKKKKKTCDEHCQGIIGRQRSMQTIPVGTQDKNEGSDLYGKDDRKVAQTSTESEVGIQLSARPSKEGVRKRNVQDKEISQKENKGTAPFEEPRKKQASKAEKDRDVRDEENRDKSNGGTICSKCGRQKRECSGCRNTIIIPYASGSNRTLPAGEAESLRMIIKMQGKETNRQFDSITAELNSQKSEIRRLNDLYQKMVESFYDLQKSSGNTRSQSKNTSDVSHDYYTSNKRQQGAKSCGCSFSNECRITSNKTTPTRKSTNDSSNACACTNNSNNSSNGPSRRFGPPNTAVAINMCDTCTVEIAANNVTTGHCSKDQDYFDGDKQRKDEINRFKKSGQYVAIRPNTSGGKGDIGAQKTDSVSTIYKNEKRYSGHKKQLNVTKRYGHENLLDNRVIGDEEEEEEEIQILPRIQTKTADADVNTETDNSETGKKPRNAYSSRVLIWLKKSWITIKQKTDECHRKDEERREECKTMNHMFNLCQSTAKRAAASMWKSVRNRKMFRA